MDDEEDDEVLLEGGELHQYLSEILQVDCPVYTAAKMKESISNNILSSRLSSVKISSETRELIQIILNSSLMLEDDACSLHLVTKHVELEYQRLNFKTLISFSSFALTSCACLLLKKLRYLIWPFWLGSIFSFISFTRKLISYRQLETKLEKLCTNIDKSQISIRKSVHTLNELIKCLTTKEVNCGLRWPKDIIHDRYKHARREVHEISVILAYNLLELVQFAKKSTLLLTDGMEKLNSEPGFIASKTDSELGLDKALEECSGGKVKISTIEALRHLNILIQSEFLCKLGFALCKKENIGKRSKLLNIIKVYGDFVITFIKKTNRYLDIHNWKDKSKNLSKNLSPGEDITKFLHNLRLCLHSMAVECDEIEETLSIENVPNEKKKKVLLNALDNITGEVEEMFFYEEKIRKLLGRQFEEPTESKSVELTKLSNEAVEPGSSSRTVEVGKSDFSIRSPDEVFVNIPRLDNDASDDDEKDDDNDSVELRPDKKMHACYDRVVSEIKVAIKSKKEEFDERELAALKNNPKYEHFLKFENEKENKIYPIKNNEVANESNEEVEVNKENIDFQKAIAQRAVQKSLKWNLSAPEETSFES